ncbi:hypothetical protein [Sphingobacterium sp. JUb78]|uniref:hypothetical protein n=2 Tax=Sphingobacterium TaxID=28453 RepID=UPI001FB29C38|nr:hypothetical protein [Sphingobacterium sp. JUb78]
MEEVLLVNVDIKQLLFPFMILCLVLVTSITKRIHLPDIANTRAEPGEKRERSIRSFRHFALGVVAIFFYVGTEVAIGANSNLHAFEWEEYRQRILNDLNKYFGIEENLER